MKNCPSCRANHQHPKFHCHVCGWRPETIDGIPLLSPEFAHDTAGFDSGAYEMLSFAEDGHFWFRSRNKLITHTLRKWFPGMDHYLEVGCGTGCVLSAVRHVFPHARMTATEVLSAGIGYASRRVPGVEFLQSDARTLPYTHEFDVIGAYDVLEHIEEDEAVLVRFRQALRPGGGLLLSVPQHPSLWSSQDALAHHVRRYRRGELESKLRNAGFSVLCSTSFMAVLLPILWMSRNRSSSESEPVAHAQAELAPSSLVNAVFEVLLAFERGLLRLGLRLPVGSSRLIVATVDGTNA